MDFVTIVSIWPVEQRAERPLHVPQNNQHNTSSVFVLPAAAKGDVVLLRVGQFTNQVYMGNGKNMPVIIKPEEVGTDLVLEWAERKAWTGMPDRARPGIWLSTDPNITKESVLASPEYQTALAQQRRFAQAAIAQAREFFRVNRPRDINDIHFYMADYMGLQREPWQQFSHADELKDCPACGTSMKVMAMICPTCKEVVDPVRLAKFRELMAGTQFAQSEGAFEIPEMETELEPATV